MKIKIFPDEIVKMCLWDNYVYYVLGSEKEAEKILKENTEMEISERDALIIGLLKVVETDNLIHRFNDYLVHFLTVKSIKEGDQVLTRKKSLEFALEKFLDKFPDYWTPPLSYKVGIQDLIAYIDKLKVNVDELEIIKLTIQNVNYEFYNANVIKKMLNFNY
jgi:hypothetical protein